MSPPAEHADHQKFNRDTQTSQLESTASNRSDKNGTHENGPDINSTATTSPARNLRDEKIGMLLGLTSAVAYSATNLALRQLSDSSEDLGWDIWVSAMKAVPTLLVSLVLLVLRGTGKGPLYPSFKIIGALFIAALVMQFGGNLCFQIALGNIGLAISVPFVFALIIFSGAFFGRIFVGDTVSVKTLISIAIMTGSVIMLSYAASQQDSSDVVAENQQVNSTTDGSSIGSNTEPGPSRSVKFGIFMAIVSGLSYGVNGIVIRSLGQKKLTIPSMTVVYSSVGFICLGSLGYSLLGFERIQSIPIADWVIMLVAGSLNAIAFFAITNALKRLDISRVNVINASQNAMCALGAFLVFAEPMSALTVTGILLSIIGLVVLDRK